MAIVGDHSSKSKNLFTEKTQNQNSHLPSNKYRPDIDGLRAVAVLSVVIFHAFPAAASGGYVGVDIFFVISGFLITNILHGDLLKGRFSISLFYERRARRILPALTFMVSITTVLCIFVLSPVDLRLYFQTVVSSALFVSNIDFWRQSGYFESSTELKPLLHTWSLAVEEQFYIFYPILLWVFWKLRREKLLIYGGFAASLALSVVAVQYRADADYYLIPTRAWELMIGAILALGSLPDLSLHKFLREAIAYAGLAMIALSIGIFNQYTPFPGYAALLPCVGAGMIIYSGQYSARGQTRVGALLSTKPVVFVGLVSYSFYLWHWPLLALARYTSLTPITPALRSVCVVAAFLLSVFSWRYIERPFRQHSTHVPSFLQQQLLISRARVLCVSAAFILVFVVFGAGGNWLLSSNWFIARAYGPDYALLSAQTQHVSAPGCVQSVKAALQPRCRIGDSSRAPTVAIWGDSVADALVPAMPVIAPNSSAYAFIFHSCPSILETTRVDNRPGFRRISRNCRQFNTDVAVFLGQHAEIKTVILLSSYGTHLVPYGPDYRSQLIPDGYTPSMGVEARRTMVVDKIVHTISELEAMHKNVIVIGAYNDRPGYGAAAELRMLRWTNGIRRPNTIPVSEFDATTSVLNDRLRKLQDDHLLFVDPKALFCPAGTTCTDDAGIPLLSDGSHLTFAGAKQMGRLVRSSLHGRWL